MPETTEAKMRANGNERNVKNSVGLGIRNQKSIELLHYVQCNLRRKSILHYFTRTLVRGWP